MIIDYLEMFHSSIFSYGNVSGFLVKLSNQIIFFVGVVIINFNFTLYFNYNCFLKYTVDLQEYEF